MNIIEEIFEYIATAGGIMPHYKAYGHNFRGKQVTFYTSLKRLEQRGLIKKKQNKLKQEIFVITDKGRRLLHKPAKKVLRTDGYSTLITFDIPQSLTRSRNTLRRYLLKNDFTLIQKSFLISPNKIDRELIELIHELKLQSYIKIISGKIDYIL